MADDDDDYYANYVSTAIDNDFTLATIAVIVASACAVYPLSWLVRHWKTWRRQKRRDAARRLEGDAAKGMSQDDAEDDGGGTYARMEDAAGDAADASAASGDKKVFLNGDVLTSLIEAGLDGLDDYEGQETALASFPADDDRQNESRLLVEDEDGVTREVVVPRLRWLARLLPRSRKSKETWRRILEERSNLMASAVCAPPDFDDEDGEDLKDSYFVDDDESDRAVKITVESVESHTHGDTVYRVTHTRQRGLDGASGRTTPVSWPGRVAGRDGGEITGLAVSSSDGGYASTRGRPSDGSPLAPGECRPASTADPPLRVGDSRSASTPNAIVPKTQPFVNKSLRTARILFRWDAEAARIVRIALPSTIGSAGEAFCSAATSALVSRHWGADQYVAYSMASVLLGLASALTGGIGDASGVLVAQAVGGGRCYLAGQYRQAGNLLEYFMLIPMYGIVWYYFVDIMVWMGLGEEIGELGLQYVPWLLLSYPISDCSSAISELMWAEEHGGAMTILDNVYYVVYIAMLVALVYGIDANQQPTLWQLGILDVVASVLYLLMIYVLVECKGWLNPYKKGLLRSFSIKNLELVRGILVMSVPLTIGGIVSTCMWEILTVFATHMGAAEVAAWTILGSIWGVFEYLPTGFATAAELLVSRYLANAQPAHAKVAAYKSLLFSLVAAAATAGLFLHFRVGVVAAYTDVEQISDMLMDLILLVGIANIVMVVGSTAYTILCSQNRANLATVMYTTLSFTATMPLSSYFVYTKGYDLQSVVFSLIVGYSLSSVVLVVIVLTTNWTKCSEAVVRSADAAQEEQERLSMLKLKRKNEKLIAESDDQGRPNSGLYEL